MKEKISKHVILKIFPKFGGKGIIRKWIHIFVSVVSYYNMQYTEINIQFQKLISSEQTYPH